MDEKFGGGAGFSYSALTAAKARAAHLIVDKEPYVFADTLASALLGDQPDWTRSATGPRWPAEARRALARLSR